LLVLVVLAAGIWWNRTRGAFLIEVYGQRPILAARLGLTPTRAVVSTMLVSGVAAGLAGWMQLAGVAGRLGLGVSAGIGFAGLAVAVLGRGNPIGIVIAAILYSSLTTGANGVQVATGATPASIGTVTQGVLLLAAGLALASGRFRSALIRRRAKPTVDTSERGAVR
jgi:simple sugar transport system permease protein